jgi:hypothetical protein
MDRNFPPPAGMDSAYKRMAEDAIIGPDLR